MINMGTAESEEWLTELHADLAAADPAPVPAAAHPGGSDRLVYFRWHGAPRVYFSDYDAAALLALHRRLEASGAGDAARWCIFDNTASGAALGNALALADGFAPVAPALAQR